MDPEHRKLLEEVKNLTKENHEMLRDIRRSMRISRLMSMLYWVFIIGSAVGAYYIFQPYIEQFKNIYGGASEVFNNLAQ